LEEWVDACDKMEIQIGGQAKGLAEKYQMKRDGQKTNARNEAGPDEETRRNFSNEALVDTLADLIIGDDLVCVHCLWTSCIWSIDKVVLEH
jgi:hypothetical protein